MQSIDTAAQTARLESISWKRPLTTLTTVFLVRLRELTVETYSLWYLQVTTRDGIRAMETIGARAMETKAMATVDTITTTTPLVTTDTVLDMITVSIAERVFCGSVHQDSESHLGVSVDVCVTANLK